MPSAEGKGKVPASQVSIADPQISNIKGPPLKEKKAKTDQ